VQATRLYLFGQEACGYPLVLLQHYFGITLQGTKDSFFLAGLADILMSSSPGKYL